MPHPIVLASDHAAVELRRSLAAWLRERGYDTVDLGPETTDAVDYPDYGYRLAREVGGGRAEFGVALCGSGIGISIAVNRHPVCRCALVSEPVSAAFARSHNDANVIAMGARLIGPEMAQACLAAFLSTDFLGDRHARRVQQLSRPLLEETR